MFNPEKPSQEKTVIRKAEMADISSIRNLLENNLGEMLTEEQKKDGFVTWNPSDEEMSEIINDTGIVLSMVGENLKGYAITMSREVGHRNPFFSEMLESAEKMEFEGRPLSEYRYVVFAQICIDKMFRGGMTFHRLHVTTQNMLKEQGFEMWVGEIADSNKKSLAVHSTYEDVGIYKAANGIEWHIIVGDLRGE